MAEAGAKMNTMEIQQHIETMEDYFRHILKQNHSILLELDLAAGVYKRSLFHTEYLQHMNDSGDYQSAVLLYANTYVVPGDREAYLKTASIDNLKRLREKGEKSITMEYCIVDDINQVNWLSMTFYFLPFGSKIFRTITNLTKEKHKQLGCMGIFILNGETLKAAYVSKRFLESIVYDYSQEEKERLKQDALFNIPPQDRRTLKCLIEELAETGEKKNFTYCTKERNGKTRYIQVDASLISPASHPFPLIMCLFEDITRTRELENKLQRESQERERIQAENEEHTHFYDYIYNSVLCGIAHFNVCDNPSFIKVNIKAAQILGFSGQDSFFSVPRTFDSFIFKDDRAFINQVLTRLMQYGGKEDFEHRIVRSDGEVRWIMGTIERTCSPSGRDILQSVFMDITDKNKLENALLTERERYALAMETSSDVLFEYHILRDELLSYKSVIREDNTTATIKTSIVHFFQEEEDSQTYSNLKKVLSQVIRDGVFMPAEIRIREDSSSKPDGYCWYLARGTIICQNNRPARIIGTLSNICSYKSMEQQNDFLNRRLNLVLSSSYEDIFESRHDTGEIIHYTKDGRLENSLSYNKDTVGIHPDDVALFKKRYQNILSSQPPVPDAEDIYIECRKLDQNGVYRWYSFYTRQAQWDKNIFFTFIRNIDSSKREELERQEELKQALADAKKANEAKTEFLSRMSHDIRTPMNAIIGMTSIAKQQIYNQERVLNCLNKIDTSSGFLLSLINDILDMSRIESGKLSITPWCFNFRELMDNIVTIIEPQAACRCQDFCISLGSGIRTFYVGDSLRINQIITNLLSNALKFTPENGFIRLAADEVRCVSDTAWVEFTVLDSGKGISKEFLSRLFEPFEQEDGNYARNSLGSGLGLSIVSNLVKLMKGTIDVESTPQKGTRFSVVLPLGISSKNQQCIPDKSNNRCSPRTKKQLCVLLAEDNDINMEIAQFMLEERCCKITCAQNGREALDAFSQSPEGYFDLIIMDIRMPVMDGLEAARRIRRLPRFDALSVPIAAMTANAFPKDKEEALEAGIEYYITKPIHSNALDTVLSAVQ